jgi:hypothetical protein
MRKPVVAMWFGCALLTFATTASPRDVADAGELTTCTACRMAFMKCVTRGAGLPEGALNEVKRQCAEVAALCFKSCKPEDPQ